MTYNGNPLLGKQVVVVTEPGLTSAKLVMSGETLDISELMGMIPSSRADESDMDALMNLPTCGVIPGSVTNELTVELNSDNEFNGSGETEFVTFSYDGKITEESLVFNITDATLKDGSLAGSKWEIYNEPNPWYDPEDPSAGAAVTYNGVHACCVQIGSKKCHRIAVGLEGSDEAGDHKVKHSRRDHRQRDFIENP